MKIRAILPAEGRDLRLDLFRGVANWAIFINHIPNNVVTWLTNRNYGFSDGADLFVFIAGYAAAIVYAKSMLTQGFAAGTSTTLALYAWRYLQGTCYSADIVGVEVVRRGRGSLA